MKYIVCTMIALFSACFAGAQTPEAYAISIPTQPKQIVTGHLNLGGSNPAGVPIAFNSYYMSIGQKPFIPIMGEFHFSRFPHQYWEESILKMKSGGINVIATYVFWNIHEWQEGVFDWSGDKDLRGFLELCQKHNMFTLVRIGPFCHGEIRNGGLPDWLYGRPFEVRSNDEGYLFFVRRLYHNIAQQLQGLYYKDGGNIIGIQLENELQHSAAPWAFSFPHQSNESTVANYDAEITKIGVSVQDRQTAYADLGRQHLATLKKIATDEGMMVPLYTVTGWGMAAILDNEAIPVTAAYPYPFWAKPSMSPFFLFKDIQRHPDYPPVRYDGARYPSFCAEMGVGIQITYDRRPQVAPEASEALMLRTLGSGSNGIGYYMYHGGLTPQRPDGGFFSDEPMGVPKISYDFQAPIGEYGKTHDSYRYLRIIHLFIENFGNLLAPMGVCLPENAASIKPDDRTSLRYAVRSDGRSGFVFLNNFQDHDQRIDQNIGALHVKLADENITFPAFTLPKGVSAIWPFNLKIGDAILKYATVQPLSIVQTNGKPHYIFYAHDGIVPVLAFDKASFKKISCKSTVQNGKAIVSPPAGLGSTFTLTDARGDDYLVTTLTREQALHFNQWDKHFVITSATLLPNGHHIQLQSLSNTFLMVLPATATPEFGSYKVTRQKHGLFVEYTIELPKAEIEYEVKAVSKQKYTFAMKKTQFTDNLSDIILDIDYVGDNAFAFSNGKMLNDNLYYGKHWPIGLKQYADDLDRHGMYFYFRPMPKNASYLIDFDKYNIPVFDGPSVCRVNSMKAIPEYRVELMLGE